MRLLKQYALSFLGKPYHWGGNDPNEGFDCSGLVIEILQSCGMLPHRYDATAQMLYDRFRDDEIKLGVQMPKLGDLVFFGRSKNHITHVGFMLDSKRMLEAGGGGSNIKSLEDAIKHDAFIRIRPIDVRSDLVAVVKPRYAMN